MNRIRCSNCSRPYPDSGVPYRCPVCYGIYDYSDIWSFDAEKIEPEQQGIWRYKHTFTLPDEASPVSLSEGNTPLVWSKLFNKDVVFKLEYLNPTGSFKDRGTAAILSFIKSRDVETVVEDSSGNAGASLAAYAARAGIKARVFIPDTASGPKKAQIQAYGADLVKVLGPRTNASRAAITAADQGVVYASHVYLPHGLPAFATIAYEILEQLNGAPGSIISPVGHGSLILGVGRGFQALKNAGLIADFPVMLGVQARVCAPLWALSSYGASGLNWVTEGKTIAEGIRIQYPIRGDAVLQIVEKSKGKFLAVDEEDILPGLYQLCRKGFFVEPTSATVWAALKQIIDDIPEPIVVILTGSGYKTGIELFTI
ncbi:MAG: pyridoxal-phosphate dependent enzyme [Anaerolineales bacterium]|nr:pyridoxal-phosphate dependent enzyme [Anaerolineales bacterium]